MDSFLLKVIAAGIGVALSAAPIGVFLVWRRMAYFGDSLAHSALLGVALGLILGIQPHFGVILVAIALAILLLVLDNSRQLGSDTHLTILAHGALSFGLLAVALQQSASVDLMGYLIGDILSVTTTDLLWIWGGGLGLILLLLYIWRPLLSITVHEELAQIEDLPTTSIKLTFMLMIALLIAISMKIVGALLISAMMIISAASARRLSRTPEQMAGIAAMSGLLSVLLGIAISWHWDTPTGPSVVVAACLLFGLSQLLNRNG